MSQVRSTATVPMTSISTRSLRSKVACIPCRLRKVRCDVAQRGPPCTNCYLDYKECEVDLAPRSTRRRRRNIEQQERNVNGTDRKPGRKDNAPPSQSSWTGFEEALGDDIDAGRPPWPAELLCLLQNDPEDVPGENSMRCPNGVDDIGFSVYNFIRSDFLLSHPQDDIKFLESQGCLRVPRRDLLDDILEQFFRHVHPTLPLFNEGHIWALYHPVKHSSLVRHRPLALFVVQAIIFSACNLISKVKLHRLGFESVSHARRTLYRRAKMLYFLDTQNEPASLAQGALLLSGWSPPDNNQEKNSWWLAVAIQHAKAAGAHVFWQQRQLPEVNRLELKRLWWSCILQDSIMALSLRRSAMITRDIFDFDAHNLTVNDINEAGPSIYKTEIKRVMTLITVAMCEMSPFLTDACNLAAPRLLTRAPPLERQTHLILQAQQVRENLQGWHARMNGQISLIPAHYRSHDPVFLFIHLLHMHFHSTLIMLYNYEIELSLDPLPPDNNPAISIQHKQREVQESVVSITDSLREIINPKMAKLLPISVVNCTAHPLLLLLLDQSLSKPTRPSLTTSHAKLLTVLDAMRIYQPLYENTKHVLRTVYHLSSVVNSRFSHRDSDHTLTNWGEVLTESPRTYSHLIRKLDTALSCEYLAQPQEISTEEIEIITDTYMDSDLETSTSEVPCPSPSHDTNAPGHLAAGPQRQTPFSIKMNPDPDPYCGAPCPRISPAVEMDCGFDQMSTTDIVLGSETPSRTPEAQKWMIELSDGTELSCNPCSGLDMGQPLSVESDYILQQLLESHLYNYGV